MFKRAFRFLLSSRGAYSVRPGSSKGAQCVWGISSHFYVLKEQRDLLRGTGTSEKPKYQVTHFQKI